MIDRKKKKLMVSELNSFATSSDDDEDEHFVDFGLVGLHEQGFENAD